MKANTERAPAAPPANTTEELLGVLRRQGGRVTAGRRAIVEVLVAAPGHLSAEDVVASVQEHHPEVHLSTVYRTLENLELAGVVEHVHLGHGAATWHLAEDRRHHLVCDSCGSVTHVPPSVFQSVADHLAGSYGFAVDLHHFAVSGRCGACL